MTPALKLTTVQTKILSASTLSALETAIQTFLAAGGEARFLAIQPFQLPTDVAVLITYTKG